MRRLLLSRLSSASVSTASHFKIYPSPSVSIGLQDQTQVGVRWFLLLVLTCCFASRLTTMVTDFVSGSRALPLPFLNPSSISCSRSSGSNSLSFSLSLSLSLSLSPALSSFFLLLTDELKHQRERIRHRYFRGKVSCVQIVHSKV